MTTSCFRVTCVFAVLAGLISSAAAQTQPARALTAARNIRVLVPAGVAARWPLYAFTLDGEGQPSYNIRRRYSGHSGPQTVATVATRTRPEIPRTRAVDAMSEKQEPVALDKEVFVPALGRKVRYYLESHGGGADNDYYMTEPVPSSDGHGGTLWIVIQAEVTTTPAATLLASVKWVEPGKVAGWRVKR